MLIVAGGPMFAGKTTWLLDYAKKLPKGSYKLYKPSMDTRFGGDVIVSHSGKKSPALNVDAFRPTFSQLTKKVQTLLIDELNFFNPEALLPEIKKQLKAGRTVVGAGLLYDFQKKPFGATSHLAKMADTFTALYAICEVCGEKAEHSYRKVKETSQVLLGAKDVYGACCVVCWGKVNIV